ANVEEAAYNALVTEDGKMLVNARLAVRNNQRSFLKLTLPASANLWSVSVAGRPIRPGRAPDGSLLVPLEKTRGGEESPAFVVEVAYLDRVPAWGEQGRARLTLLAVDMPISKSSLLLHQSPLFRLTPAMGSFRAAPYEAPTSAVLRSAPGSAPLETQAVNAVANPANIDATQAMVSKLQQSSHAARPPRNL